MLNRLRNISTAERWTLAIVLLGLVAVAISYPPQPSLTRPWLWRSAFLAIIGSLLLMVPGLIAAFMLRRPSIVGVAAIAGAVTGLVLNAGLTFYAAKRFEVPIHQALARLQQQTGTITIVQNGRTLIPLRLIGEGRIERSEGLLTNLTPLEMRILCAAEDERCFDRKLNIDLEAIVRVLVTASNRMLRRQSGRLPGGSNLSEQVAGLLLGLKPAGPDAIWWKLDKMLAAFEVDLFPREQQAAMYLSLAPFGNWHGQDIVGIAAASHIFYGRDHSELSAVELAELMARLRNPVQLFPYRRPRETEEHYVTRLEAERLRAQAIVYVAARKSWLHGAEVRASFSTLVPAEIAGQQLDIPHAKQILDAVQAHVPDAASRRLIAATELDPGIEKALVDASAAGFAAFYPRLPVSTHADDFLEVDASVVDDTTGHLVAEVGMAAMPGGCASHCKPELYALALETRSISSINEAPPCSRVPARLALAKSLNETALCLIKLVGPARYMQHLRDQGYAVQGPYVPIALGAGVEVSPRRIAANYLKFGFAHAGWRVEPDIIARIIDAKTGAVLYEPVLTQVLSNETAIAVRTAMEDVPRIGTASRALGHITGALPSKTGTAGAFRRNAWQGDGGSWCVTIDARTKLITAVRVRWRSNHPFELEGGQTAAVIMAEFIQRARRISAQRTPPANNELISQVHYEK